MLKRYAKRVYKPVTKKTFCKDCTLNNKCDKTEEQFEKCLKKADLYRSFCEVEH